MEDWNIIRLSSFPSEIQKKNILGLYVKDVMVSNKKYESTFFALFEGSYFISFKVEESSEDDLLGYLLIDNEFADFILPTLIAIVASVFLLYRRRQVYVMDNQ
jgi:hypothetical protein